MALTAYKTVAMLMRHVYIEVQPGSARGDCGAACAACSFGMHYDCRMSRCGLHREGREE